MTTKAGARERGNAGTRKARRPPRRTRLGAAVSGTAAVERAMRRTWAEVDLDAIAENVRALQAHLEPSCRIMAVVKAEAYGHGGLLVARSVLQAGATWLGVATVDEGIGLRRAGIEAPVLVLGHAAEEDIPEALRYGLRLTIGSVDAAAAIIRTARRRGGARVHLKVDTGMHRLGVMPQDVRAVLGRLVRAGVHVEGCYTHLSSADDADPTVTREQLSRFESVLGRVRRRYPKVIVHAANSAAALAYPRARYDMVRVGLAVYGLYPAARFRKRITLRPAMRLLSRVVRVVRAAPGAAVSYGATYRVLRPTTIATVACGYADGYPRLAGARGLVVIRGQRLPVAGRVCMDHLMVDAGDEPVASGDEVELFGRAVSVDEVAGWAQTISYEVICGVGLRVPRLYTRQGKPVEVASR